MIVYGVIQGSFHEGCGIPKLFKTEYNALLELLSIINKALDDYVIYRKVSDYRWVANEIDYIEIIKLEIHE